MLMMGKITSRFWGKWQVMILSLLLPCLLHAQQLKKAFTVEEGNEKISLWNATSINSTSEDFSPAYLGQGIVFPSSRHTAGKRDKKINTTFFELFYSDLDPNHKALKPQSFSAEVNSILHEGPVCFSQDGNTLYFTRNNTENGLQKSDKGGVTRMKIYQASRGEYDWENITELPFNQDHYSAVHPTFDYESGRMYFSSNMVGGEGGYDLYYVEQVLDVDSGSATWSEPIGLGKEINSPKNELFPFFHNPSKQLIFSSNGYEGSGGLDLYMVDPISKALVVNLGQPFNSENDDLGLILDQSGTKGFFSSNRSGGMGKDDIYGFTAPDGLYGKTRPISFPVLVETYDAISGLPLANVDLRLFEKEASGYYRDGKSLFEAVLLPQEGGNSNLLFKTTRVGANKLGSPDQVSSGEGKATMALLSLRDYIFLASKPGYETTELKFSTATINADEVVKLMLRPRTCLQINGSVSSASTKGTLPGTLIKVKSISTGQESLITTDQFGRFNNCLELGDTYNITAYKDGFEPKTIRINPNDFKHKSAHRLPIELTTTQPNIQEGSVIVLENIYYDFDKYQIRAGAALELEELAHLMRIYPSMEILLSAHTDARGDAKYNQTLSERRARAAAIYLNNRDVSAARILKKNINITVARKCSSRAWMKKFRFVMSCVSLSSFLF